MKKILITGASGFIGSTLVDTALAKGWDVTAAIRPTSDRTFLQDPRIKFLELNFKKTDEMREKLVQAGRFDYIIHNAGTTKAENKAAYLDVNAGHTRRLAEAINASGLKPDMFLLVSSLASYGPTTGDNLISTRSPQKPVTSYGESKVAAENDLAKVADFPYVMVQPTAVYGARDRDIFVFINLVSKGLEFYIGTRPQKLSFIHAQDLCDLMLLALERGSSGRKYIGSDGKNYISTDLGAAVKSALGKKTFRLKIPLSIVGVIAGIAETVGKWRGKVPPLNREKMGELGAESWHCDANESFTELNFQPRFDLFSGMKATVEWYKKEKWI